MGKLKLIAYYIIITIATVFCYLNLQDQWISYRVGQIAFDNQNYQKALTHYLDALERGMDFDDVLKNLAIASSHQNEQLQVIDYFQDKANKSPDSETAIFQLASYYLQIQQYEKATSLFQYLPLQEKKYLLPAINALMGEKDFDLACHYLHSYLENHPKDDIRWFYAKKLALAHDNEKAIKEYQLFLNTSPSEYLARIDFVNLLLSLKMNKSAYDEIIKIPKQKLDFSSRRVLGDLMLLYGDHREGRKILEKQLFRNSYDKALVGILSGNEEIAYLDLQEHRLYPKDEKTIIKQADEYFSIGQNKKGIATLVYLADHDPKNRRYILDRIGDSYRFFVNNLIKAEEYYRKALALEPDMVPIKLKLGFVLGQLGDDKEAYPLLQEGKNEYPLDISIQLELARIDLEEDRIEEGKSRLETVLKKIPDNRTALFILANYLGKNGYVVQSKEVYQPALNSINHDLHYAYLMQYWGDFYKAEKIYRNYLLLLDKDEARFSLAWLLVSTNRFEEATGIYRKLLEKEENRQQAYLFLAKTKVMEKKLDKALKYINESLSLEPTDKEALTIKADILFQQKEYDDSILIYQELTSQSRYRDKAFVGLGKNYLKLQKPQEAKAAFNDALAIKPKNVDARFYLAYPDKYLEPAFVDSLLTSSLSSKELTDFGGLYSHYGHGEIATSLFEAAHKQDTAYYPAKLYLAQILARDKQFDRSEKILDSLLLDFPDDYLFTLWKARMLSWKRDFDQSMKYYRILHRETPSDPQIIREMARSEEWNKEIFDALRTYNLGFCPSVDTSLKDQILLSDIPRSWLKKFSQLSSKTCSGKPYALYEKAQKQKNALSTKDQKELNEILAKLRPEYLIQKSIFLEKEAAYLFWEQKYAHSLPYLEELVKTNPQNVEAQFDLGQADCQLGLCQDSRKIYKKIIEDSPSHRQSLMAYDKNTVNSQIFTRVTGNHWSATGRGEIDQIRRWRTYFGIGIPIHCQHLIYADGLHWYERPSYDDPSQIADQSIIGKTFTSLGYALGYHGTFSPYVNMDAEVSQKFYYKGKLASKTMGFLHLNFRCYESLQLQLAFDRTNHMGNYFALTEGIQYNQWSAELRSVIKRRIEMIAQGRLKVYKDNNTLQHHDLETSLILHTFPEILKIGFKGEYRDSRTLGQSEFNNQGKLITINHPYWTPDKYFGGRVIVKWRHDISKELFCEANKHVYDITLSSGSDTELNPFYSLEGSWDYQMTDHLSFHLRGMVHKSKVWDADELWFRMRYQF